MRIALLTPTYWPEVRRGTERVVHDLAVALTGAGHEVSILTTHPARSSSAIEEGVRVIRDRRPPQLPGLALHEHHLLTAPAALRRLVKDRFDLVNSFFPPQSWTAVRARRLGGPPVLASIHGIPTREYLVARKFRLQMMVEIAERAEGLSVLSEAALAATRRYLLRDASVLPGGVSLETFAPGARSERPTIFCAGSLGDPRKRAALLFAAFRMLRQRRPEVGLVLSGTTDPFLSSDVPGLPEGARWVAVDKPGLLEAEYARAWATVNPGREEAFGLVALESLASGTPAVADDSGAGPEILTPDVGRLFQGEDPSALADALEEALAIGADGRAAERCRARAREFGWMRLVTRYEDAYSRVVEGARDVRPSRA